MTFSLNTIILEPLSKEKPKNAVILCHGYGGDGKDISILASYWRAHLTETIFICPDAPEKCAASPTGFQWFDLMDQTPEQILSKSLVAENKLNKLIDEVKEKYKLKANEIIIGGFSQGCMMSINLGLTNEEEFSCIVGFSGKIINQEDLKSRKKNSTNVLLIHGDADQVVSPNHMLEAKDFFIRNNLIVETHLIKNCDHHIPIEASSIALNYILKKFNNS